jgi:hypothetical protein
LQVRIGEAVTVDGGTVIGYYPEKARGYGVSYLIVPINTLKYL